MLIVGARTCDREVGCPYHPMSAICCRMIPSASCMVAPSSKLSGAVSCVRMARARRCPISGQRCKLPNQVIALRKGCSQRKSLRVVVLLMFAADG